LITPIHLRRFTAVLIILAVAIVLFMPQIEMPDAVVNSYRVVAGALTHLATVSFSVIKIATNGFAPRLLAGRIAPLHHFAAQMHGDSHVLRAHICVLRFSGVPPTRVLNFKSYVW